MILAYLIAVVPLNWLICRFVLNRREWAWIVVPLVALGFAIGVERVAAHDMGYDTAADEIDLLEIHGDYPRAHLTRLVSLYTTGRSQFRRFPIPNDPTALALPLDNGRSIRGEEVSTSIWQSSPVPALLELHGPARSLSMFRAEQMLTLGGPIRLEEDGRKAAGRQRQRARAAGRDPDRIDRARTRRRSAGWARSSRVRRSRSTANGRRASRRRVDRRARARRESVP